MLLAAGLPIAAAEAAAPSFRNGVAAGTNSTAAIAESSGLAASRMNPHVLWTHNDSGDSARLFAIHTSGRLLGTFNLTGASATDWEDIAIGADPGNGAHYLYAGDIGDNNAARTSIAVYRVREPAVSATQSPVTSNLTDIVVLRFTYPDGARDAETLLADDQTGDLYIISKRETRSRIYRAPFPQNPSATTVLEYQGELAMGWTTGGDIAPSGRQILIRTYANVFYFGRTAQQTVAQSLTGAYTTVPCAVEPQGEAVCWQGREHGYYTLSENAGQPNRPIYWYASADTDSDGLSDSAEIACGSDLNERDSDGDGQSDGEEWAAGENPTNGASFFAVTTVSHTAGRAGLAWYGRSNRTYSVQQHPGQPGGSSSYTNAVPGILAPTDGVLATNVPLTTTPAFLRVRVQNADGW